MKRLSYVSVSILVVIALFMSQSWAVTAACADYSVNGSAGSNDSVLEGSAAAQDCSVSEEQKSDGTPKNSESQNAQLACSDEASGATAADSAESTQLTVKNVSVSAHVQNIGWMNPVGMGKIAGTTGRGLNLEALKISVEVDGASCPSRPTSPASAGSPPSATAAPPAPPARPAPSRP